MTDREEVEIRSVLRVTRESEYRMRRICPLGASKLAVAASELELKLQRHMDLKDVKTLGQWMQRQMRAK